MKNSPRAAPYLFLIPALAVFGFAVLLPVVMTFTYSFTDWDGYGAKTFVGFDNYIKAITDPLFRGSFVNIIGYIAATLILEVLVGLLLAGLVHTIRRSLWFRVAIFTPVLLPMVVVAILWSFVYNADFGLLNAALEALNLQGLERIWLGDTDTALLAISVTSGWVYAGFFMTIFYAAFGQIDPDVIEAARLDGAGEWRIFSRIKVPIIKNSITVGILLCVTGGFQGFDLFYVMTNGGPYGATEIPTTYLVKSVFTFGNVGYGSAMSVVLTAVIVTVGLVFLRLGRGRKEVAS